MSTHRLNVQPWLDDAEPENPSSAYDTVVCKACSRLHFINRFERQIARAAGRIARLRPVSAGSSTSAENTQATISNASAANFIGQRFVILGSRHGV
jgi:hypothetical protein